MVNFIINIEKRVPVYNVEGEKSGDTLLPQVFNTPVRKDLIKRAFQAEFTAALQPKGRDPMAGKRTSARSLGVGRGLARIPRIPGTSRGVLVNITVGGRLAHPPRVEKKIHERINKKEKVLATASAIAATGIPDIVRLRGHRFSLDKLPVVISNDALNSIKKTREARVFLEKIGVLDDVIRAEDNIKVRAGKGKRRGRKYIVPKSVLFVLDDTNKPLARALRNLPGVNITVPMRLSVLQLAPGGFPGRLTVYMENALETINERFKNKLVML